MRILKTSDYISKPWKNGLGTTLEILVHPLFRLSMADLTTSGPFSLFPERDRILVLLEGPPIILNHHDQTHRLDRYVPYSFDGAWETWATITSPGKDFNLMTEKGKARGNIRVESFSQLNVLEKKSDYLALFVLEGEIMIADQKLSRHETAILLEASQVDSKNSGKCLVIEINLES